jgi:predicted lipoprotein
MNRSRGEFLGLLAGLALAVGVPLGCGTGGASGQSLDERRSVILARVVADVVLPAVRDADADAAALEVALDALAAGPTEATVLAAQAAWRDARWTWNRAEAVLVGPALDRLLATKVDTSPIDEPRIEEIVAGAGPIDVAFVRTLGSTRKGFHAIELLLFDESGDVVPVVASLTTGPNAARRVALLDAYGEDLADVVREARFTWEPTGEDHASDFSTAGIGSSVYPTRQAAIDALLNHWVAFTEVIADKRLGRPLGRTAGGLPQEPGAECQRSGNSRLDVLADLVGLRDAYEGSRDGSPGAGVSSLVRVAFVEVHAAIRADLDAAIEAVEAIPEPLLETAQTDPAPVEAAFQAVRAVRVRLLTDLTGVLGGTLTFSPFDGD